MKAKTMLILFGALSLTLTSCGSKINYQDHLEDYIETMEFHNNFNVLQLTDIHWNVNSSAMASKRYLEKVLKEADRKIKAEQGNAAKIDLIEMTGDQFMLSNANHVKTFISFFEKQAEELGFKYTLSFSQ